MAKQLILIVEDNEKSLKLLKDVLRSKDYETVEATTAEEGLELVRTQQPALILMDIRLPGMNGVTALMKLREDASTKEIPVIAVTASAMPMDRGRIMSAGFDGYITKPISVKEFLVEVSDVLEKHSRAVGAGDTSERRRGEES